MSLPGTLCLSDPQLFSQWFHMKRWTHSNSATGPSLALEHRQRGHLVLTEYQCVVVPVSLIDSICWWKNRLLWILVQQKPSDIYFDAMVREQCDFLKLVI